MKTCPICGAGAFDDALVCFGCLYRYEQDVSRGPERSWSGAMPRSAPVSIGAPSPDLPALTQVMPVKTIACVEEAVASPEPPLLAQPLASTLSPFDDAGWVVRFELPGFIATSASTQGLSGVQEHSGKVNTDCALLAKDRRPNEAVPRGLVVRFQQESIAPLETRRGERLSRGHHAREVAAEDRPIPLPEGLL